MCSTCDLGRDAIIMECFATKRNYVAKNKEEEGDQYIVNRSQSLSCYQKLTVMAYKIQVTQFACEDRTCKRETKTDSHAICKYETKVDSYAILTFT